MAPSDNECDTPALQDKDSVSLTDEWQKVQRRGSQYRLK